VSYAIGVDGGKTKTVALVADMGGRVVGAGRTGCSNWEIGGEPNAAEAIAGAVQAALSGTAPLSAVRRIHLGLAGVDWPGDEERLRGALSRHLSGVPLTLENDAYLPVRAASPEGTGVAVSAGSGVCAALIEDDGVQFLYGYSAEMGGGIDINAQTLHAVVRADDGRGPPTVLTERLLAATGHRDVQDLLFAITRRSFRIAGDTARRVLFGAARDGDGPATTIVTGFATELALLATNVLRKRGLLDSAVPVIASGSLFTQTGPLMFSVFEAEVRRAAPNARTALFVHPPASGALRAALEACGVNTRPFWTRLTSDLQQITAARAHG
jgi:N-acetylglucosamine kinase-like BadF-type ATPase